MRTATILLTVLAAVLYLGNIPAFAQRGRGGAGHPGGSPAATTMPDRPSPSERHTMPDVGRGAQPEVGKESHRGDQQKETRMAGRHTVTEQLTQNTRLSSKLAGLLPAGTNLPAAAAGFKNLGAFVAAVHVSHNLGIPFDQLKARIVPGKSLGQAIHELHPKVDAKAEAKKAKKQAKEDVNSSVS